MGRSRGPQVCSIDGCAALGPTTRGWCRMHYIRWWRTGSLDLVAGSSALKECDTCGKVKPVEKFHARARRAQITTNTCTSCRRAGQAERAAMRQRDWSLKQRYGISAQEFDQILARQRGGCAICGRFQHGNGRRPLHVDHDHASGLVRGILCGRCNQGIGYFSDDPYLMQRAIAYLKREGE